MRFFENGPSIPDELLIARDEGRVVFFCGAGVSLARAKLPGFFKLSDNVIEKLGLSNDDPAHKLLQEAKAIDKRTGATGVISADCIFGLLEREFDVRDQIEAAVAEALTPKDNVDLLAHRILIDLATTQEGKVRLVTTNFDRLFDLCSPTLKVWQPPRLPDPSRPDEMNGIIYLHGRTNEDYSGSEGDGFILSRSEFGRAYLSEGWATAFFKEILDRYVVVFVGYSADDSPIQYLLEALNKKEGQLKNVYAFEKGEESEAAARWRHKGVEAIAFTEFSVLWETLEAWAERAKAPQAWYQSIIELARKEPGFLQPHERGQVAHIISTDRGVRKFSQTDPPLPANWLCVFDSSRRYAKPGYGTGSVFDAQRPLINPFDLYRLDSDRVPNKIDLNDYSAKREIPPNAWDAFTLNRLDRKNLQDHNYPSIQGYQPCLPSRLFEIGVWISKVADQPATVWWAATQKGLHPTIQRQIKQKLKAFPDVQPVIHQAWQYLFEIWEEVADNLIHPRHRQKVINRNGWDNTTVRKYAIISRPYLKITPNNGGLLKPPEKEKVSRVSDLIKLDVEYPDLANTIEIPDEWLPATIREIRKNLEYAIQLETEIDERDFYTWFQRISPIEPDNNPNDSNVLRRPGFSDWIILFSDLFNRLIKQNIDKARQEFTAWPVDDDTIFARLRIWASGKSDLFSEVFFCQVILGLNNKAFWDAYHQRDLLVVLAKRWNHLPNKPRKEIEIRLLNGPDKWNDEETQHYEQRKAWDVLNRITWLANNDCRFTFDIDSTTNKLRQIEPRWKPEDALKAADTMVNAGGMGRTDLKHTSLLNLPLRSILPKAEEDFRAFVELSSKHPDRAFATLTDAVRINEYPEWAWRIFLCSEARKDDKPEFSAFIAERISRYPDIEVCVFIHSASRWSLSVSKQITSQYPASFDKVITKLINVLRHQTPEWNSSIIRDNKEPDWSTEEINAPAGYIAQALLNDARLDGLKVSEDFPDKWLKHLEDLLFLHGDLRRNALVIFFGRLNWFHNINPDWTEVNLLSILDENDEDDHSSFWSGFLDNPHVTQKLYLQIKPSILAVIKKRSLTNSGQYHVLAEVILEGWGTVNNETHERLISNNEMRSALLHADETFRSNILFKLEWLLRNEQSTTSTTWLSMMPEFLKEAWPLQKRVKSPAISNHLCDLAFFNIDLFPEMSKIILPLLMTLNENNVSALYKIFDDNNDNYIIKDPHQFLNIIDKIIPDNVDIWPENTGEMLDKIAKTNNLLKSDEKLIELKRRWNAR